MSIELSGVFYEPDEQAMQLAEAGDVYKKEPIRDIAELNRVRDVIASTQPLYFRVSHAIMVISGNRPGDVSRLKWKNINFDDGVLKNIVRKQTQAAQTRAVKGHFRKYQQAEIDAAKRRRDYDELERLEALNVDEWAAQIDKDELAKIKAEATAIARSIRPKMQVTALPRDLIDALKELKNQQLDPKPEDYIFDSLYTDSPRTKGDARIINPKDGKKVHVHRTTLWRRMNKCIKTALAMQPEKITQTVKKQVNGVVEQTTRIVNVYKYSLYSCRKIALWFVSTGFSETIDDKAAAEFIGHSSPEMSAKYTRTGLKLALNEEIRPEIYAL